MAIVYVSNIIVPRTQRNKRIYQGFGSVANNTGQSTVSAAGKAVIPFSSDTPTIVNYNANFSSIYGQFPTISLITTDQSGNRITRSELPYFIMVGGLIDSITFGQLPDGIQTGFILISQ